MTIQVVFTLRVELTGDDYSTHEPDAVRYTLPASPAQLWQYELQAANNYLLIPAQNTAQLLLLDPQAYSGATWTLKGSTADVGVQLSSSFPSVIPVSPTTPIGGSTVGGITMEGGTVQGGTFVPAPQYQIVLTSSIATQTQVGWL